MNKDELSVVGLNRLGVTLPVPNNPLPGVVLVGSAGALIDGVGVFARANNPRGGFVTSTTLCIDSAAASLLGAEKKLAPVG